MRKIILALAMLVATSAQGAMISYKLTFVVEQVYDNDPTVQSFFVDDTFHGSLLVDDSILATDGPSNAGMPHHLRITMGDTVWAQDFSSDLAGLRGPCYNPALACTDEQLALWGLGSDYLGFEVLGGVVVGLWGGVFGSADFPFVDFNGARFNALPYRLVGERNVMDVELLQGSMSIRRLPTPGTLALMGLGLAGLAAASRRKQ